MPGFDSLVGRSLSRDVRDRLGHETSDIIEQRLGEKHGMSLAHATEDFTKLDKVLQELFGEGADGIEKRLIGSIIAIKQDNEDKIIIIEDSNLTGLVLESFGDSDKKKIMNVVLDRPMIISDILEQCDIAQTSGYRKINNLINDGFLIADGYETREDGKKVNKYVSVFDNVRIQIEKNKVLVHLRPTRKSITCSTAIRILAGIPRLVTAE